MRTWMRSKVRLLFVTCAVLLAIPAVALADQVLNDVVAGGNDTITAGNSTTINYRVNPGGGPDTQPACNVNDGTPATVTINKPAAVTASPGSLSFNACNSDKPVVFSSSTPGNYSITVSVSDSGGGTFNTAPAAFTLHVNDNCPSGDLSGNNQDGSCAAPPPANTAPHVSVTGVTDGASYDKGSVPAAICNVTDTEDGNSSFDATLSEITGDYASDGIGQQTATCSYTDGGGLSDSDLVTYSIIDPSAPVITKTVTGDQGNNGWYTSDVDVDWTVSDPQSPNSLQTNGCADFSVTSDQAEQTYTCEATSAGGTSSDSVTIKRDATAPTVTATADSDPNGNGWYKDPFTVSFSGTDATSDNVTCDDAVNHSSGDTQSGSITGSCTDEAGNSGSATFNFKYDATAPTISGDWAPKNSFGWNNGDVTVHYTCSDATSQVASCQPDQTVSGEGAGQSRSGSATDNAGNTASTTVNNINIDLTDPLVSLVGGPANNGSYYFGSVPSAPTCNASDALSGLDGACSVNGYSNAVGSHTVKAEAKDKAANTASESHAYTVLGWTLDGFKSPVDMGIPNDAKGGSTVPLKFEVFAGPTELTSTSVVDYFTQKISCASGQGDAIEQYSTGNTELRYDTTSGQFIFNWKTPKAPGSCYRVTLQADDGSKIYADFRLK